MSYYASDTDIGDACFDGEDVSDANVIPASRLTSLKNRVNNYINRALRRTTNATDVNDELKEVFLYLFDKVRNGGACVLSAEIPDEMEMLVKIKNSFGTGSETAGKGNSFYLHDPQASGNEQIGYHDDLG